VSDGENMLERQKTAAHLQGGHLSMWLEGAGKRKAGIMSKLAMGKG
jgi:hypothetical protein